MVIMIWETTEIPEIFKRCFPLYQEKKILPLFFHLELGKKYIFV